MKKFFLVFLILWTGNIYSQVDKELSERLGDIESAIKRIDSLVTQNNGFLGKAEYDKISILNARIEKLEQDSAKMSDDIVAYRNLCADTAVAYKQKRQLQANVDSLANAYRILKDTYNELDADRRHIEEEKKAADKKAEAVAESLTAFYEKPFDELCADVTLASLNADQKEMQHLKIDVPERLLNLKTFKEAELLLTMPYNTTSVDAYEKKLKAISETSAKVKNLISHLSDYDYIQHSFAVDMFSYIKNWCIDNPTGDADLKKERRCMEISYYVQGKLNGIMASDKIDIRNDYPYIYGMIQDMLSVKFNNPDKDITDMINKLKK